MANDDFLDRIQNLSPKRLALLALDLHEQLEAAGRHEPIAVIGIGCRFPGGADGPDTFWQLLRDGRDAIGEVPPERWDREAWFDADPDAPGRMSVRHGGFLDGVDGFDAAFFGISPREAQTMDPQQRLVLEVAWEALEHAGLAPDRLAGSATGVFLGICNSDHFQRVLDHGTDRIDAYLASGNAHSVASGRLSYFLHLQGPALSIDTACSSSLVALHVACQSLRSGECAHGAGRRRQRDVFAADHCGADQSTHAGAGRALQNLRCRGRRVFARRRLRRAGAQAPRRRTHRR